MSDEIAEFERTGNETDYPRMEVECHPSPKDKSVNIATVSLWQHAGGTQKVTEAKLLDGKKISRDEAISFAKKEALRLGLSRIYVAPR